MRKSNKTLQSWLRLQIKKAKAKESEVVRQLGWSRQRYYEHVAGCFRFPIGLIDRLAGILLVDKVKMRESYFNHYASESLDEAKS